MSDKPILKRKTCTICKDTGFFSLRTILCLACGTKLRVCQVCYQKTAVCDAECLAKWREKAKKLFV